MGGGADAHVCVELQRSIVEMKGVHSPREISVLGLIKWHLRLSQVNQAVSECSAQIRVCCNCAFVHI